jgi:2-polyprenyl-6-methoxyphenol hydroxylase-like FAD-dependent oxidoreductase
MERDHGTKGPRDVEVLIVGAGPTGLTLAIDLARRGVHAVVVERGDALFPGSRGKGLQPRTMEVLDDLGVVDRIRAVGGPYPVGLTWRDGVRQGEQSMFDAGEPTEAEPYQGPWMVPQWRTQEVLLDRLRELGGGVAFSREVIALEQDAERAIASFASGPPVRASYVVAADGGRSTVRHLAGIAMIGETIEPRSTLVADVRVRSLDRDHWHIFPPRDEAGGFLAMCPLPGTEDFQLVAQFPEGARIDASLDGIRALVAARTHLAAADVMSVRWASDFRPRMAVAERFRAGRVFLAGDAAHVHSPAGGQGLNTSIQDAYNLGWKLGAVLRGHADASLLDTYEAERRPIAKDVLALSSGVHRGSVRRGRATEQLDLGYRESPLSVETRAGLDDDALRAGDRAPDGRRGGVHLFDLFRGPHWTLLLVDTDAPVPAIDAPLVRVPAYDAYGRGIFLVRPDGYVGWAGTEADELAEYAARVGLTASAPNASSKIPPTS